MRTRGVFEDLHTECSVKKIGLGPIIDTDDINNSTVSHPLIGPGPD